MMGQSPWEKGMGEEGERKERERERERGNKGDHLFQHHVYHHLCNLSMITTS